MKADLEDALVPVKWAEAQVPILQQRLLEWNRSGPYRIIVEPEFDQPVPSGRISRDSSKHPPISP